MEWYRLCMLGDLNGGVALKFEVSSERRLERRVVDFFVEVKFFDDIMCFNQKYI